MKRNRIISIAGILIGAAGGYLYYHYIGCRSGSCGLTSNPYAMILWGGGVGYLLADMIKSKKS